jgi:hypothetical protein
MKQCEYCGNATIEEEWAESRDLVFTHDDRRHYFCSYECKMRYELEHEEAHREEPQPVELPHPHAG